MGSFALSRLVSSEMQISDIPWYPENAMAVLRAREMPSTNLNHNCVSSAKSFWRFERCYFQLRLLRWLWLLWPLLECRRIPRRGTCSSFSGIRHGKMILFRKSLNHIYIYRILNHIEPHWTILNHIEPYWTILNQCCCIFCLHIISALCIYIQYIYIYTVTL